MPGWIRACGKQPELARGSGHAPALPIPSCMKLPHPRASYANITSTIALLVALGGSAYALTITGADVRDGSLTGRDIQNRSIAGVDLATGSATSTKLADGSVTSAKLASSAVSSTSIANNSITADDVNLNALATWKNDIVTTPTTQSFTVGQTRSLTLSCGPTAAAISGGISSDQTGLITSVSHPGDDPWEWIIQVTNNTGEPADVGFYVMCINVAVVS